MALGVIMATAWQASLDARHSNRLGMSTLTLPCRPLHEVLPSVSAARAVEEERHALLRARRKEHRLRVLAAWAPHVLRAGQRRVSSDVLQHHRALLAGVVHLVPVHTPLRRVRVLGVLARAAVVHEHLRLGGT